MDAALISVPYLCGREGVAMGAGPLALAPAAAELLGTPEVRLRLSEPFATEVAASFDLNRQLAAAVAEAVANARFPVVLTGNCHSQQAVVAGLGRDALGLVWLDAHADFHTPDTTTSGFFDGYALAMVVGRCWKALCHSVPGFSPLGEERVVLVGARAIDDGERELLEASAVARVEPGQPAELPALLRRLPPRVKRVSLHVDLDVLDPAAGKANAWSVAPGLSREELLDTVRAVAAELPVVALTLSAYDPSFDLDGRVREAALAVLGAVLDNPDAR